jgi:hypothetical protein
MRRVPVAKSYATWSIRDEPLSLLVFISVGQRCSWNVASTTQILEAVETKTKIKQQWEKQISR